MPLWQAILLGIIQGLTEFLPVSSTAHLLVAQELLGRSREQLKDDPFTVVIQLGTLIAVFWYFRQDIAKLWKGFCRDVAERKFFTSATPEGRMVKLIVVGTIPVVLVGGLFAKRLKEMFYNPTAIAWVTIIFALLLAISELWHAWRQRQGKPERTEAELTYGDAILIGCFQALALMPGGSRSGTTITAGLFAGLARPAAARFSFLLSLPSVLAAGVKDLYDWLKAVNADPALQQTASEQAWAMVVGGLVSAIVGYFVIAWLLHYLRRHSTWVFIVYRLAMATLMLILIHQGLVRG
jgi:undecaprenyl-diphosphatase